MTKRDAYLRRRYGLTEAQWRKMIRAQRGKCAICGRAPKPGRVLHTDHCHTTGRVRGGLCYVCNRRVLGRGRETPELHEAAARYLRLTTDWRQV